MIAKDSAEEMIFTIADVLKDANGRAPSHQTTEQRRTMTQESMDAPDPSLESPEVELDSED